ncbi:tyrosine-protein phosphatase [Jongsikchunia kroppenstedtii]|uniref:tyrosine-protein phosphatase n=1 Tax=Jongsikchunia kroppenstedtii TaxID=1121721 RepID=UPI000377E4D1|nr:tyrosine-protein phosphatase [Jongsikchunia kroppenstedtii]
MIAPLAVPTASATPAGAGASMGITPANARDIGGYDGLFGSTVKTGLVYRSNAMTNLNAADLAKLATTGITDIIDFRSPAEAAAAPDSLVPTASNTKRPIYDPSNDFYALVGSILAGGASNIQAKLGNGGGATIMENYYRWVIATPGPTARNQLAATFKEAATSPTPILYHCTSGKDRTGMMTAILLTALGTPKNEVYEDYLKSNANLAASNAATIAGLEAGYHLDAATAHLMDPILGVQASFLDAAFDQMNKSFGSFANFVRTGLGIDDATLAALRKKMLNSPGNSGGGAFGSSAGNGIGFGS